MTHSARPLHSLRKHIQQKRTSTHIHEYTLTHVHTLTISRECTGICIKINNILRFPRAPKTQENVARGWRSFATVYRQKAENTSLSRFVVACIVFDKEPEDVDPLKSMDPAIGIFRKMHLIFCYFATDMKFDS